MKTLLLALIIASPITTFGNVVNFQCLSANNVPGVHKFDAAGTLSIDENNQVEGVMSVSVQKSGSIQSTQTFEEVRVSGFIRHFAAGQISKNAFSQLVLKKTDAEYITSLNLLLDYQVNIASRLVSIDNFSYRSNCKLVEKME